jgi:hypothetical protein
MSLAWATSAGQDDWASATGASTPNIAALMITARNLFIILLFLSVC